MKKYKTYQIVVIIIGLFLCFFGRFIPVSSGLSASGAQTLFYHGGRTSHVASGGRGLDQPGRDSGPGADPGAGHEQGRRRDPGNSTVFYLLLCFMLAKSLQATGVAHRLAVWFLTGSFSRKGAWCTIAMIFVSIFVLVRAVVQLHHHDLFCPFYTRSLNPWGMRRVRATFFPRS